MRPEDLGSFLETALGKIEPRDEEHRKKLEQFGDRLRKIEGESRVEIQKAQEEIAAMREESRRSSEQGKRRVEEARELWSNFWTTYDEQTETLRGIVKAAQER